MKQLMNTASRYLLVPVTESNRLTTPVVDYWTDIQKANLLKPRFVEQDNPTLETVEEMVKDSNSFNFMLFDPVMGRLCADTMLNNFRGLTAHVHFSIHPDYHGPEAVQIAKAGAEQQFTLTDHDGNGLCMLVGMTPVTNRLAIRFINKVGFKKVDIFPKMFYSNGNYIDAYVSTLEPKDLYT